MSKRVVTRRFKKLRDAFFEEGKRQSQSEDLEVRKLSDCWLCKQPIDYSVGPGTTSDSHTLDHRIVVDDAPEMQEDPTNFEHAHYSCNSARGKRAPSQGIESAVPDWW